MVYQFEGSGDVKAIGDDQDRIVVVDADDDFLLSYWVDILTIYDDAYPGYA
jgi:hypothetical protein